MPALDAPTFVDPAGREPWRLAKSRGGPRGRRARGTAWPPSPTLRGARASKTPLLGEGAGYSPGGGGHLGELAAYGELVAHEAQALRARGHPLERLGASVGAEDAWEVPDQRLEPGAVPVFGSAAGPGRDRKIELLAEMLKSGLNGLAAWWYEPPGVPRELLVDVAVGFAWLGLDRLRSEDREAPEQGRSA